MSVVVHRTAIFTPMIDPSIFPRGVFLETVLCKMVRKSIPNKSKTEKVPSYPNHFQNEH
jgi:hypothetical protein